ncbi:hypothetical protein SEA_LITTLEFELLA_37 [Gordonia phage LittleFella]|nr:hypothetical protein SEA_LITTLEFELLA_37 [Gordonia phage LittleFella]
MPVIAAASTGQVRYAATLALRVGQVPTYRGVTQPTMSQQQFRQVKNQLTQQIGQAVIKHPNAPVAPHQQQLLQSMAALSGVAIGTPANRQQADNWAIAWFKANQAKVPNLITHIALTIGNGAAIPPAA